MNTLIIDGVNLNKHPIESMCKWIKERYLIHLRKDVEGKPYPWTDWPALRDYQFTNVMRKHDKESRLLIESTLNNSDLSYADKILNIFLFRVYSKFETYSLVGFPRKKHLVARDELLEIEKAIETKKQESPDYVFFTNAFICSGIKSSYHPDIYLPVDGAPFRETSNNVSRMFLLWNDLILSKVDERIIQSKTAEEVGAAIQSVRGFASDFLSFQVYVDLTYIKEFSFTEDDWVLAGPGCKWGLDYIFPSLVGTYVESLVWLRDHMDYILALHGVNLKEIMVDLPMEERRMSLSACENLMCELSKLLAMEANPRKKIRKYRAPETVLF